MSTSRVQKPSSFGLPARLDHERTLGGVVFPPVIGSGLLLVTRRSGALEAYDENSGERVWSVALGSVTDLPPNTGAPLIDGDLVHVSAGEELLSIEMRSGSVADRRPFPPVDLLDGAFVDDCVVSYVPGGRLEAWEVSKGTVRWAIKREFDPVPIAAQGNLVVTAGLGSIAAYDVRDGHQLWTTATGDDNPIGTLVIAPDDAVVASVSKQVVCLDAKTGAVRWMTDGGVARSSTMAVTDKGEIHLLDLSRYRRLSVSDGSVLASHDLDRSSLPATRGSLGRIAVGASHVFAADQRGPIIAVSRERGSVDWKWEEPAARAASVAPVLSERRLYALDLAGTLLCFVAAE